MGFPTTATRGLAITTGRSPGSRVKPWWLGMRRLPRFPQWLVGAPALAYRCGGSTGLAPVSRLPYGRLAVRAPSRVAIL